MSVIYNVVGTAALRRVTRASFVKIQSTKDNNPQETNAPVSYTPRAVFQARSRTLVGSSEAIRLLLFYSFLIGIFLNYLSSEPLGYLSVFFIPLTPVEDRERFNEWLGGLIVGDGCFLLSKKKYASLEIVVELRGKHGLYQIKQAFGGAVQLRAGDKRLRYRLHNRSGLLALIAVVNGHIRNPVRLSQLNKVCVEYGVPLHLPPALVYRNG